MRRVRLRLSRPARPRARGAPDRRSPRARQGGEPRSRASSSSTSSSGATCSSARAGRARCPPICRASGTRATSRPGTASSRSTSTSQMNYWPAEVANLSECHEPLFDLIDRLRVTGAETAERHYGCRGFVAHHNTDLWADTAPLDNVLCGLWPAGGSLARAPSLGALRVHPRRGVPPRARLPGMKEAARFVLDFLVEDPATGELVFGPSLSPENHYLDENGLRSGLCMSPAGDTQIISGLFDRCLAAAAILGGRRGRSAPSSTAAPRPPARDAGRQPRRSCRNGARTTTSGSRGTATSRISSPSTPMRRSRRARHRSSPRLRRGHSSCGSRTRPIARSAAGASRGCRSSGRASARGHSRTSSSGSVLRKSTDISLLDLSPPGGTNPLTVFQIDGNLGAVAAVCEMLVQSHDGDRSAPRAAARVAGGERVGPAASWRVRDRPRMAGRLARAGRAPLAGRVPVRPQDSPVPLAISRAGDRVATERRDGLIHFDTEPGSAYAARGRFHYPTRRRLTGMKPYWQGVFPAVTTQMHRDGSLDLEATARHLEVLIDSGVGGLVMCGSLGENQSLDRGREAARGRGGGRRRRPGACRCSAAWPRRARRAACRYVRDCAQLGADGFMVMPAMVYNGDDRETLAHFRTVAAATDAAADDLQQPDLVRRTTSRPRCSRSWRRSNDRGDQGELGEHAPDHRPPQRGRRPLRDLHRRRRSRARERRAGHRRLGGGHRASRSRTRTSTSGI